MDLERNTPTQLVAPVAHVWPVGTRRLWPVPGGTGGGRGTKGGATHLFRRKVVVPEGARAVTLWIFAEGNFAVWFAGRKVGRGPWLHRPERRTVTELGLPTTAGEHVIAVAAQHLEANINKLIVAGEPGVIAWLRIERADGRVEDVVSDASWKRAPESGWRKAVRRGWALGHLEWIDAAVHPTGWESVGFDDSAWTAAECQSVRGPEIDARWFRAELPDLVFEQLPARGEPAVWRVPGETFDLASADSASKWGDHLHKEQARWRRVSTAETGVRAVGEESWEFEAKPGEGLVLMWDLGALFVGGPRIEVECESTGVCEVLWSERVREDGTIWAFLKNTTFADRWDLTAGRHVFASAGYSSMRYVALAFRGLSGRVRLRRVVVEASHLATGLEEVLAEFKDPRQQAIWELCHRTLVQSPQDGMTDCPSREQSVYASDAALVAEWLVESGGDLPLARHTMREMFLAEREGYIPDCIYSASSRTLVDFGLIAVGMLAKFVTRHDDVALARELLPRARAIVERVDGLRDARGLIAVDWSEANQVKPSWVQDFSNYPPMTPWLFVDHPGMGWHNVGEPEIDRSGVNTAVHALLVFAERGATVIAEKAGEADEARAHTARAEEIAGILKARFWDAERRLYPDGLAKDGVSRHASASAQTNTFCLLADVVPAEHAKELARRAATDALPGAWNGPYAHAFLLEVLARLELREEALALIERRWGGMVDAGASCAWETFAGDHLDSWCHPWSAAPVMWLPRLTGTRLERRG